jgi:hypothetical protein
MVRHRSCPFRPPSGEKHGAEREGLELAPSEAGVITTIPPAVRYTELSADRFKGFGGGLTVTGSPRGRSKAGFQHSSASPAEIHRFSFAPEALSRQAVGSLWSRTRGSPDRDFPGKKPAGALGLRLTRKRELARVRGRTTRRRVGGCLLPRRPPQSLPRRAALDGGGGFAVIGSIRSKRPEDVGEGFRVPGADFLWGGRDGTAPG